MEYSTYPYYSPQKTNTLIVKEGPWGGGRIDVFYKTNLLFMKPIKDVYIAADDGYRPFMNGNVEIEWLNEDVCIISYLDWLGDDLWHTEEIRIP